MLIFLIFAVLFLESNGAGLVIQIPNTFSDRHSNYRLAYDPPIGKPPSNSPINDTNVIQFTDAKPGTHYFFWIYSLNNATETNSGFIWAVNATTAPDPPKNLKVNVIGTKSVLVTWDQPEIGNYSEFILRLDNITTGKKLTSQEVKTNNVSYQFYDLNPGATYQLKVFTIFEGQESQVYISRNFTTRPNTPGKFIVWFRNETTLLVLWQPPHPPGVFSEYIVSITPNDTEISVISVKKENDPPGPAQAEFKDLVPGRAYEISVQTVSEDQFSLPTKAIYRTTPLKPYNLTFDYSSVTPHSFVVRWSEPKDFSEFDKYSISLNSGVKQLSISKNRDEDRYYEFNEHLEPGMTYLVLIKTVAGKVSSYSTSGNITLLPLPVQNMAVKYLNGSFILFWSAANNSHQNAFKISYHETVSLIEDSSTQITNESSFALSSLLPGRNYSISVRAISNLTESSEVTRFMLTKPSTPVIGDLKPLANGLNISWKSDVNSKQDFFRIQWIRNDTGEKFNVTTAENQYYISDLYPGAAYIVKLYAMSHNLSSDPQEYFQPIFPKPPEHLRLIRLSENSVIVRWDEPVDTLFSEYSSRLRTSSSDWSDPKKITTNSFEINDLDPGESYTIQINTVSYNLESVSPQQITYTIRPDAVRNMSGTANTNNITLNWLKPKGTVQKYLIRWMNIETEHEELEQDFKEFAPPSLPQDFENKAVQVVIENLRSGFMYFLNISTFSNNLESNVTQLQIRTLPLIDSDIIIHTDTRSIIVRYTETPRLSSKFDHYRFSVNDEADQFQNKEFDDKNRSLVFSDLVPGYLYDITAVTVSFNISSRPIVKKARLYPEPITSINTTYITDKRIDLYWYIPNGKFDDFVINYLRNENDVVSYSTNYTFITLNDLRPYRNYTFIITVRSGVNTSYMLQSEPLSATFQTKESVPERVDIFRPVDVQPTSIRFKWSLNPESQNGILLRYTITYGPENSIDKKVLDFGPNEVEGSVKQLLPGHTYVFQIQAETSTGYGLSTEFKQKMPILAPPKPAPQVVPTEVFRSKNTIQVRFRKNYFSDDNGNITAYTVIVAEDTSKNTSGLEMPSWYDVQAYSKWPPYQVLEPYYPFSNNSIEDFTIGTANCDLHQAGYCNGPLKSGTTYMIKIRAFSATDKFTDTSYSFPMQTDNDNTSTIMSVFVTLLFTMVVCAIIMFLIRYKKFYEKSLIAKTVDNLSLPESMIQTSRPVRIESFANHYRIMTADSDFRFSEEFEELKHVGRDQSCSFADLSCNRPKNRFTNILPYDHSRFKLQPVDDEEGSDYINANYVPGFNSPREFIVTQGPLHSTRDDFWRMCWESNSRAIVMLTRCIEKGREKCDHYWPYDTMPVYYGDISVQILNDSHYTDWSTTELLVCRGNEQRVVRHFHFTTWPDFGVPNPPQILIKFVRAFRERIDSDQRPIVVHCSAGVGRSGTFIALDRLLQQIKMTDVVDIFGIVYQMRKERVWMVQTEQQYICIHQCLLTVLEGQENGYLMLHHDNELLSQSYEDGGGGGVDIINSISAHDLSSPKEDILMIDCTHDDEKDSAIIEGDDNDEYLSETDKDDNQSHQALLPSSFNNNHELIIGQ